MAQLFTNASKAQLEQPAAASTSSAVITTAYGNNNNSYYSNNIRIYIHICICIYIGA